MLTKTAALCAVPLLAALPLSSIIMTKTIPTLKMSNGVEMPVLGLGTWQSTDDSVRVAVEKAVGECGYPLIDTAAVYANEQVIGDVLSKLFKAGKVHRDDVFITTKLWTTHLNPARAEAGIRDSLAKLQLERVDLLLAHMPTAFNENMSEQEKNVTVEEVWKGLESIYEKGLARAIGVSNWNVEQIERVLKIARIPIHNVQVELYLYFPQDELVAVCAKHGITLTSYGSLGSPGRVEFQLPTGQKLDWAPAPNALDDPVVKELADKYKKTPAQILLRFCLDRGVAVIPKSVNADRLKQNIDVFDFKLAPSDLQALLSRPHRQRLFLQDFMAGHPEDAFASER